MVIHSWNVPEEYEADILSGEETMSLAEVGRELYLTRQWVHQLVKSGKLRGFKSKGVWCVTPTALRDYRARKFKPPPATGEVSR